MPVIGSPSSSPAVFESARRFVQVKENYSGQWVHAPYLEPLAISNVAAPETDEAQFRFDFGEIMREQKTTFVFETPFQIRDYYVRVLISNSPGSRPQEIWRGVLSEEQFVFDSAEEEGVQNIVAFGLGHLLDRKPIDGSFVEDDGDEYKIDRNLTFNLRGNNGPTVRGNRSKNEDSNGVYRFSKEDKSWTAKDVAEYLLENFSPDDVEFKLGGLSKALESRVEVWEFAGMTCWQALNVLIDRRRGLVFDVRVHSDGDVYIWVESVIDRPVKINEKSIPGNSNPVFFQMPSVAPYTHLVGEVRFRTSSSSVVDAVIARGEPIHVTATFSYADETLTKGWDEEIEKDYVRGLGINDLLENDEDRATDQEFHPVYRRHVVPDDWDWLVGDGVGGDTHTVLPTPNDDGTVDFEDSEAPRFLPYKRFEKTTPFLSGFNYHRFPIEDKNSSVVQPDYRPLFVIIHDEDGLRAESTDRYFFVDALSEATSGALQSSGISPLENNMGVHLDHSPRHYHANAVPDSHFKQAGVPVGVTGYDPVLDYENLIVTASFRADVKQIVRAGALAEESESGKELVIDVPGAEYWRVIEGTVVAINGFGQLERINPGQDEEGLVLRDDRDLLLSVAVFSLAWYGIRRQAVVLPIQQLGFFVPLGSLLTRIDMIGFSEPVRTVISAKRLDFNEESTTIETGFAALDVLRAMG